VATSTAHRSPPPSESELEAPRPEKDFSLQRRLDAALAPDATVLERDALLYAIARPLPPEAPAREHADFLLALLADERSRSLTGSHGRSVKKAATQALLALGYPYALEIPPEAFGQPPSPGLLRDRLKLGKALIWGNALGPAAVFTLFILGMGSQGDLPLLLIAYLMLAACTLLPMFLLLKGRKKKSLVLQVLGTAGLILSGFAVGALALAVFPRFIRWQDLPELIFASGGLLFNATQLVGAYLLHSPQREE
jgi:hypothetical protein